MFLKCFAITNCCGAEQCISIDNVTGKGECSKELFFKAVQTSLKRIFEVKVPP
jgi:hypothetical protein